MPVEFNDESNQNKVLYGRFAQSSQAPKLVTWLLRIGVAKNENQANYILVGVAIISIILAIYIQTPKNNSSQPKFKEDIPENVRNIIPPDVFNNLPSRN